MERWLPNVLAMIRVPVFSALYGRYGSSKRQHSGAVGRVLGKEMRKENGVMQTWPSAGKSDPS
jgi:hypothetical protein